MPGDGLESIGVAERSESDKKTVEPFFLDDSYKMFIKDLGREKLLTREQEIEAGKLILQGGKTARDGVQTLVRGNIRLVISNAKRYQGQDVAFMDLIQEGCIGLIRAAEKFDHRRGYKFSTYATWWIRQAMTRALDNTGRVIRLPSHMMDKIRQLKHAQRELFRLHGALPTEAQLAERLQISVKQLRVIQQAMRTEATSYDMLVGDEENCSLKDFIADDKTAGPSERTAGALLSRDVESALAELTSRERFIVKERYGLTIRQSPATLEALGKQLGCTRERVRQLEARALQKLRVHQSLKEYLD